MNASNFEVYSSNYFYKVVAQDYGCSDGQRHGVMVGFTLPENFDMEKFKSLITKTFKEMTLDQVNQIREAAEKSVQTVMPHCTPEQHDRAISVGMATAERIINSTATPMSNPKTEK